MDARDRELRRRTYELFLANGEAPSVAEMAETMGASEAEVEAGWRRLQERHHALAVEPYRPALRMVGPFSAVPTPHRVEAAGRAWHANCPWDALGICAALASDGRITTACADCEETIVVEVTGDAVEAPAGVVFHCLVPAARWRTDIIFT